MKMRMFFENPEMVINVFDTDIHTAATASGDLNAAKSAVENGTVKLAGITYDGNGRPQLSDAAIQVFEFK